MGSKTEKTLRAKTKLTAVPDQRGRRAWTAYFAKNERRDGNPIFLRSPNINFADVPPIFTLLKTPLVLLPRGAAISAK